MIYSRLILVGFLSTPAVILAQANLFNLGGSYHAGAYSNAVATADLNGDGKLDFVIASYDTKTVTILLGNGAGTFTEPAGSPFAAGARPGSVSLGDFNGDGHPDIALTNPADLVPIGNNRFEGTGSVRLFLGKGDGQFTAAAGSPFPVQGTIGVTSSAVAVDIDHDGRLDLVVAMSSGISVLIGDGAGGLISPLNLSLQGSCVNAFTAADFNHDGNLDVAFTYSCNGGGIKLGFGNGPGASFGPETTLDNRFIFGSAGSLAAGDFNGDGIPDLLIAHGGTVTVWYVPASGPYIDPSGQRTFSLGYAGALVTGDFNGDGKLDWAAALSNLNSVAVMLNDGAGGFNPAPGSPYAVGITPSSITVGDFNGDGKLDLVTGNQTDVTVLLNSAQRPALFTLKNAASYASSASFSPGTIMYGEAPNIASLLAVGATPWPASLNGANVSITDSVGQSRSAPLYYVTPSAVSFLMPAGLAPGRGTANVTTAAGVGIAGPVDIEKTSPGIFTANANGSGVAAGLWTRTAADGTQTWGYLFDPAQLLGQRKSVFVDLGAADDKVFLSLYGTGFRAAAQAAATFNDISVPVASFGALGDDQGADVINLGPLPQSFMGYGSEVPVRILFDNQPANTVTVAVH